MNIQKKYTLQIPKNISILYCDKKHILNVIGSRKKKSIKLLVKLIISHDSNKIQVSNIPISGISNKDLKKIKSTQGTTFAKIKQLFLEVTGKFYNNLKFVGVGYRAFSVNNSDDKLLMLKLGYSHLIYFRIPSDYSISIQKFVNLFITGDSLHKINQLASLVRSCRKPEPYKGKGILYKNEKIILKTGKKI